MALIQITQLDIGTLSILLDPFFSENRGCHRVIVDVSLFLENSEFDRVTFADTLTTSPSSISYSTVARLIIQYSQSQKDNLIGIIEFTDGLLEYLQVNCVGISSATNIKLKICLPQAILEAKCISVTMEIIPKELHRKFFVLMIEKLSVRCLIGLNSWERKQLQPLYVDVALQLPIHMKRLPVRDIISNGLLRTIENSNVHTLEKLSRILAEQLISGTYGEIDHATVTVNKPWAIRSAQCASVTYSLSKKSNWKNENMILSNKYTYFLSLGSNLGNRKANIEKAVRALMKLRSCSNLETSFMYQTKPLYNIDQNLFLNCCIKIEVDLEPLILLENIQQIELDIGRSRSNIYKGPREVDIDLILGYDQAGEALRIETQKLILPHKQYSERLFVLFPLVDIIPSGLVDPVSGLSIRYLLESLGSGQEISQVVCFGNHVFPIENPHPLLMGILNVTPDSFSDGGKYSHPETALDAARRMQNAGATIIDIGAQSTRPGAVWLDEDTEWSRLKPILQKFLEEPNCSMLESCNNDIQPPYAESIKNPLLISIDTFYGGIACKTKAFIENSIDQNIGGENLRNIELLLINDISGGRFDTQFYPQIASTGLPVVITHSKGVPSTMMSMTASYEAVAGQPFAEAVAVELLERVADALSSGIPRWNIIIDPGIGFAKNLSQDLSLLKHLAHFQTVMNKASPKKKPFAFQTCGHFPVLLGVSRKKFIKAGNFEVEKHKDGNDLIPLSEKRLPATLATILSTCYIRPKIHFSSSLNSAGQVDASFISPIWMLRVHDVEETAAAMKMIGAIQLAE